jgi:TRAP-type C4-dicarboxylate transport system permease small subunit
MAPDRDDTAIRRAIHFLHRFEDTLLAAVLTAMIGLAAMQILLRNALESGLGWADPVVRLLVLWLGLLGALAASRDDRQINVDVLTRLLPSKAAVAVRALTHLTTAVISALVAYQAGRFVRSEYEFESIAFSGIPAWVAAAVIPVAFGGIALRYLFQAVERGRELVSSEGTR